MVQLINYEIQDRQLFLVFYFPQLNFMLKFVGDICEGFNHPVYFSEYYNGDIVFYDSTSSKFKYRNFESSLVAMYGWL